MMTQDTATQETGAQEQATQETGTPDFGQTRLERLIFPAVFVVLLLGTLMRLWPIVAGQPALSTFYMTEDGYLLLTVARNMAIGLGMTVSEGTIPTNGIQPLITYIYTLPYLVTGGDKVTSLIGVHLLATAIALGAALAIRAFVGHVTRALGMAPIWAWAVAALWYVSPIALRHTMNALETGLYVLCAALTLSVFARLLTKGAHAGTALRFVLGALCGLTFLARIDGAFLAVMIFAVWAGVELFAHRRSFVDMVMRLLGPGILCLIVAGPWLANNLINFGSLMPISGTAQRMAAEFGQNAPLLPPKLFELFFPMLPVPRFLESSTVAIGVFGGVIGAIALWGLWRIATRAGPVRWMILAYLGHAMVLIYYYGFTFGAPHFLARYMAVIAPLALTLTLISLSDLGRLIARDRGGAVVSGAVLLGMVLSLGLLAQLLISPFRQGHEQVIAWVDENVPDETWVAAVQTGTLGYWHDRTVNLDGKVNPAALKARLEKGDVFDYLVDSDIDYIADWNGISTWTDRGHDGFVATFELIVNDADTRLAVFRRYGIDGG